MIHLSDSSRICLILQVLLSLLDGFGGAASQTISPTATVIKATTTADFNMKGVPSSSLAATAIATPRHDVLTSFVSVGLAPLSRVSPSFPSETRTLNQVLPPPSLLPATVTTLNHDASPSLLPTPDAATASTVSHTSPTLSTSPLSEHPYILFANRDYINRVNLNGSGILNLLSGLRGAVGIDYDFRSGYMYWSNAVLRTVTRARLDGSQVEDLVNTDVGIIEGIALDWVTKTLYWTDSDLRHIAVYGILNGHQIVLHRTANNSTPRAIVVDPSTRLMYWTEFGNNTGLIAKSSMDGTAKEILHNTSLVWPNGLALDHTAQKLYWVDAYTDKIESSGTDGSDRVTVTLLPTFHPYGLTFFRNVLYWTDWRWKMLFAYDTVRNTTHSLVRRLPVEPMGIKVVSGDTQQTSSVLNPCKNSTGQGTECSHLCLLSATAPQGYSCIPADKHFIETDEDTDTDPDAYLVFASVSGGVHRLNLNGSGFETLVSSQSEIFAIDFDFSQGLLFWADAESQCIMTSNLDGSNITTLINNTSSEGIAVDWISKKLYWTDRNKGTIEVFDLKSGNRKVLVSLHPGSMPRAITVDPITGWMYWTDWGAEPKIERASMNGKLRTTLHSSDITWPNGITLDQADQRIYWIDAKFERIESSNTNGFDRQVITDIGVYHPFGLVYFNRVLYWSDWQTMAIFSRAVERGVRSKRIHSSSQTQVTGITVVAMTRQPQAPNPCDGKYGMNFLCLLSATDSGGYSCECSNEEGCTPSHISSCATQLNASSAPIAQTMDDSSLLSHTSSEPSQSVLHNIQISSQEGLNQAASTNTVREVLTQEASPNTMREVSTNTVREGLTQHTSTITAIEESLSQTTATSAITMSATPESGASAIPPSNTAPDDVHTRAWTIIFSVFIVALVLSAVVGTSIAVIINRKKALLACRQTNDAARAQSDEKIFNE